MSWTCSGDWMCGACQHMNFKKRDSCQKCGFPKYGSPDEVSAYLQNKTDVLPGDWYCQAINCGAHNYASRTGCYRCGTLKTDYYGGYNAANLVSNGGYGANLVTNGGYGAEPIMPGWKSGDWVCASPACGVHNYASRIECFKCRTPREFGGAY